METFRETFYSGDLHGLDWTDDVCGRTLYFENASPVVPAAQTVICTADDVALLLAEDDDE